jgi:uncharacterized Fe-S center protein
MRKLITAALCVVLLLSLAACNAQTQPPEITQSPASAIHSPTSPTDTAAPSVAGNASSNSGETDEIAPVSGNAVPVVYFTSDISNEGLQAAYDALNWTPTGKVAVKITTGEPPNSNYLRVELIGDLVKSVNGTFVECNTAYGGSRSETALHKQVAKEHGYTDFAGIDILDENGSMSIPVAGGVELTENFVGSNFANYDSYLVLSHFKGHQMAGFGGAIKNISIGLGSSEGKTWIHTGGEKKTGGIFGGDQDSFLRAMGEAGKSVSDYLGNGERIVYINVMNRLSVDCDCNGNPAEPDIHDIGILASADPVALDQACIDLVYKAEGNEALVRRIEGRNGLLTLKHAEEIGLGNRVYSLVDLDGWSACAISVKCLKSA